MRFWPVLFILLFFAIPSLAQNADCPVVEQAALSEAHLWCAEMEANQACFGNANLAAALYSTADSQLRFQLPGDTLPLTSLNTLNSSADGGLWGVALARTLAYPVDSWQSGEVAMLIFGNVSLSNRGKEGVSILTQDMEISAAEGANIRSGPTTEFRILQPLFAGESVKAIGRLEDDTWLMVALRSGEAGWLTASAVSDDFSGLPIVTVDAAPVGSLYRPFADFQLTSGLGDARCAQASDSGVLLQTPTEASALVIRVNNSIIRFAGAIFLQTQDSGQLIVNVLEGEAVVEAQNAAETVNAGYQTRVSLILTDGDLSPAAAPSSPETYAYERMLRVPVEWLPRPVFAGLELRTIISPRPSSGNSPLQGMLPTEKCKITVGEGGANLRVGPGTEYPIRGVMDFRQSAEPDGRARGTDGAMWWRIIEGVWIRQDTTVTGGDCVAVPTVDAPSAPRPSP